MKKKLSTSEKIVYSSIGLLVLSVAVIYGWEQIRQPIFDTFNGETAVLERSVSKPTTIEGLIEEQAQSWLQSPEALDYAKQQVTEKVVEDLSKL